VVIGIKNWKNSGYRLMLFSLLAAPSGAAVAEIGITRAQFMVIPAAFFITIGIEYSIEWLKKRIKTTRAIETPVFLLLALVNFLFLDNVLTQARHGLMIMGLMDCNTARGRFSAASKRSARPTRLSP
jgi:hypothetical protein